MTIPRTVRIDTLPVSAWANGRGETIELAREPAWGPFSWRLSLATISEASPFSPLPGVARVLMAVTPGPLDLLIDGEEHRLERYDTARFTGDQDAAATGPASPQRDLNLMTRAGTPSLDAVVVSGRVETGPDVVAVVVLETPGGHSLSSLGTRLRAGDAVVTGGEVTAIRGEGVVAFASIR